LVRDAGYRAAVTVEAGVVRAGCNRLLIPRYEITPRDISLDRVAQALRPAERAALKGCAT